VHKNNLLTGLFSSTSQLQQIEKLPGRPGLYPGVFPGAGAYGEVSNRDGNYLAGSLDLA
jgi:hypothetical protein